MAVAISIPSVSVAQGAPAANRNIAQKNTQVAKPESQTDTQTFAVDGFRSAKFGMSIEDVQAAIKADFDLSGEAVSVGENAAERTGLLTIRTDKVLEDGGPAQVSYVFGHSSKKLIQVGVLWDSQAGDETRLLGNAEVLSAYFRTAGFVPETVRSGVVLDDGVLLFRGEDDKKRATVLILQGSYVQAENQERTLTPTALALLYAEDAENPDIFRIKTGQF